ncbi:hypothetical protein M413DRAFT_449923 [Hebeloma cylindrosporum]|uniref:Uncharacterized protein n=1 Tax=Hebeloma cylindrosporum TaxID=76867 RepID=A0A0C2Y1R9_HEBCY|nr:hypothetical protein M413DRAFT_449923 [Hebeloma cylindrosporum h7]
MPSTPPSDSYEASCISQASKNADPNNWEWAPDSRATWELAEEPWQQFRSKWYGAEPTAAHCASLDDPETPHFSLEPLHPYLEDCPSSILVRESYLTTFRDVWERGLSTQGVCGLIVNGQPGIGNTLFQYYALIRLLQQKQVVLLLSPDAQQLFLFYHDGVHTMRTKSLDDEYMLPECKIPSSEVFIWSLFDIPERKEPEWLLARPPCLPVQVAPLDPCRYKIWFKERLPLLLGLPLWTREELIQGLPYQRKYPALLDAFCKVYASTSLDRWDLLEAFPGVRALLEKCQDADLLPPTPEDAINYLLDVAIYRFGYSAGDVFSALFDFEAATRHHERAFDIQLSDLQAAAVALPNMYQSADSSISRHILALTLVSRGPLTMVDWTVNFKSDWIAKCMVNKLAAAEDAGLREQVKFFQGTEGAKAMSEWFFGPFAHRCIAETSTGGDWRLINMISDDAHPPQFVMAQDQSSFPPKDVRFPKVKREVIKFRSISDLSTCFESDKYYVPDTPDFPSLFDAFTVDLNPSKKSAILWVVRIPASRSSHVGGSMLGFRNIWDIIARLKDQLSDGPPPTKTRKMGVGQNGVALKLLVEVRYLVVVAKGHSHDLQWHPPKGWSESCVKEGHQGDVYCLEVPISLSL